MYGFEYRKSNIRGLIYQLDIYKREIEDFDGNHWREIEISRKISGAWYFVIEVFENGQNVYRNDSSNMKFDELGWFSKLWVMYYQNDRRT